MSNTLKFGNGEWYGKKDTILAYNDENSNYKPLPFNFSRASKATVVNKDGLIEEVGSGQPRVDYLNNTKGALLLEPSRTNVITYSEDIESWSISGTITKENNVAISPDGTLNAGTITSNASGFHRITQTTSVSSNSTYTSSLFIKKVKSQTNYMGIGFIFTGGTTDVGYVIFDAVNGIAVSADVRIDVISEVKDFGDYWKLQSTATDNGSNTSLQFNIYATLSTNGTTTGAGVSSLRTIWGAQLEQGSYATSYIPTSGSAVTRLADSCSQTVPDGVIGQTEGVAYVEIDWKGNDEESIFSVLHDGTVNNRMDFGYSAAFNSFYFNVRTNGSSQGLMQYSSPIAGKYKIAIAYKNNGFALWVNGVKEASDGSGSVPITTKYNVGNYIGGGREYPIISSKLYNTKLTDQELQALTSN